MTKTNLFKRCSGLLLCAALSLPLAAQAQTLRLGGNFDTNHSSSRAMEVFKTELDKADVDLNAALFPSMQLGGAQENVDQVRAGAVFGTWIGVSYVSRIVPEFGAISLPFAFDSREQAFRLIDGPVGDTFNQLLAKKGFVALGYMELGFRNITNNERPITRADDLNGLKIRLQPNETHLSTFRALGANPVSMDVKELYGALQQNVLDGQENPYSIIETKRFNEVQSYLSDSKHFYDFILVLANKRAYDRLSSEEKAAVQKAMDTAVAWQREQAAAEDEAARKALIDAGMTFTPISDEARAELRARTAGIKQALRESLGDDIIDQVEAELAQ